MHAIHRKSMGAPDEVEEDVALIISNDVAAAPPARSLSSGASTSDSPSSPASATGFTLVWKLLFGSLGIYAAFLYHGHLEEDLFLYKNDAGEMFRYVWLLQVLESLSGLLVGIIGRGAKSVAWNHAAQFWWPGASQVFSKALTAQALAVGLSFPVVVLSKSAKIVPVMCGVSKCYSFLNTSNFFPKQLALGGARYGGRDYLFVVLVVGGTLLLTAGGEQSTVDDLTRPNSNLGLFYIGLALIMDGVTAGLQKRIQKPNMYDFLAFTNTAMVAIAFSISVLTGEWVQGYAFLRQNPRCVSILIQCCLCSAVGQTFVFFIIATFDPLVLSTITTTRKIFSVLLSIFLKGHLLTQQGLTGLAMALTGLLVEVEGKITRRNSAKRTSGR